jgi:hypothetical protein
MARFKYMGEANRTFVVSYGPCLTIKIPKTDGTKMIINAADPVIGFPIGEDIGVDITDDRSLRFLRADSRFQEIL